MAASCRKYQEKGLTIMGYVKWSYDTLNHFCGDVFKAFGFSEEEGSIIKDVLLTADLYGIESHGMQRMVRYHKGIEKGTIHPQAKPEVVFETPISAVIDGHNGMGQLIHILGDIVGSAADRCDNSHQLQCPQDFTDSRSGNSQ